mgnify:CR=1 FL=1
MEPNHVIEKYVNGVLVETTPLPQEQATDELIAAKEAELLKMYQDLEDLKASQS